MATSVAGPQPRQERSQRCRERILEVVSDELRRCPFEEISLRRVAARAKVGLSSFYNLYHGKEALLPDLYERHRRDIAQRLDALSEVEQWRGRSLAGLLAALVEELVRMHREQRGLLRALVLRAHGRPDTEPVAQPQEMREVVPRIAALVATRSKEIRRRPAVDAAGMGFVAVLALVRECVLFPRTTAYVLALDDTALTANATALWLAFLSAPAPRRR